MTRRLCGIIFAGLIILVPAGGCWRDAPPEVPEFKAPAARAVASAPPPADQPAQAAAEPPPAPPPAASAPAAESKPAAAAPPAAAPQPEAPREPTIVGTWEVIEMAREGQVRPMSGMSMRFTFAEGGAVTATRSGGPGGASESKEGTYVLSGSQISITIDGRSRSGSLAFEGPDRAYLDIDGVRMTMARVSS